MRTRRQRPLGVGHIDSKYSLSQWWEKGKEGVEEGGKKAPLVENLKEVAKKLSNYKRISRICGVHSLDIFKRLV